MRRWLLALLLVPWAVACGSASPSTPPATGSADNSPRVTAIGPTGAGSTVTINLGSRPFALHVPTSYDPAVRLPLVVLLHGFRSNGAEQETYFNLGAESERRGFLYAVPDGTKNGDGHRFWNATDACCAFGSSEVDDSAYLSELLTAVKASYSVDAARVYLVGHSNGGFMAYRMACDHADEITAIVSLAGATWDDDGCQPARPVSVLQIHGTDDQVIRFNGGANAGRTYPSVDTTLAAWRKFDGCGTSTTEDAPKDLVRDLDGAETTVTRYLAGCQAGTQVELWTIEGGSHVPRLSEGFGAAVVEFLLTQTATR